MGANELITQSIGEVVTHACVLHDCDFVLVDGSGHATPPFADDVKTVRTICCKPPPQVAEHTPTDWYALITQSTLGSDGDGDGVGLVVGPLVGATVGHACALHDCVCVFVDGSGHAKPPFDAAVTTLRTICCTPPPHVAEHKPTAWKAPITQSTLGGTGGGRAVGPVVGATVGHTCVLHACICVLVDASGHATPPLAAAVTTVRTSCCCPPPHMTEHMPMALKPLMTQSTLGGAVGPGVDVGPAVGPVVGANVGHICMLHATIWVLVEASGHAAPPFAAGLTTARTSCC